MTTQRVVSQSPAAGSEVPRGSAVDLVVSQDATVDFTLQPGIYNQAINIPVGQTWTAAPGVYELRNVPFISPDGSKFILNSAAGPVIFNMTGINELNFAGGENPNPSVDVGFYFMGETEILGTPKTAWTHLAGGVPAGSQTITLAGGVFSGAQSITLREAPQNWKVGDLLGIAAMLPATTPGHWLTNEERMISSINGSVIGLNQPLTFDHPVAANPWTGQVHTAEIPNLTRDIVFMGEGDGSPIPENNGRSFMHFMSNSPPVMKYVELHAMGPRQYTGENNFTRGILGRYPIHVHRMGDASRGALFEGVAVHHSGNRAFVAHASHGVTFRDCVAWDVFDEPYWWDNPPLDARGVNTEDPINDSDDITYDHCLGGIVKVDPEFRGSRLSAFHLNANGAGNACNNCAAFGVRGGDDGSGFNWSEIGSDRPGVGNAVWLFNQGNVSHNNRAQGIFVWQNSQETHLIENTALFNNGRPGSLFTGGLDHGAYVNNYQYRNIWSWGNLATDIILHANSRESGQPTPDGYFQQYVDYFSDGGIMTLDHNGTTGFPILIKGGEHNYLIIDDGHGSFAQPGPTLLDFVDVLKSNGQPFDVGDITRQTVAPGMLIRIQRPNGTAVQMTETGAVTSIAPFYN